jgi:hypothetical protein
LAALEAITEVSHTFLTKSEIDADYEEVAEMRATKGRSRRPRLIAFPTSDFIIELIFSDAIDEEVAANPSSYRSVRGLEVLDASISARNESEHSRTSGSATCVTLRTEQMNGDLMILDRIRAEVRLRAGKSRERHLSPEFLHGIASIPQTQSPREPEFPFKSAFVNKVATESCQKDGGVNSTELIDTLGFSFLHVERGGPFNSIKVVGLKHVPGIEAEVKRLAPRGMSPHILWSGGKIQTIDGETRLVDTGFMRGSIMEATPKKFPPPYPISTKDISGRAALTLRAKRLQGVICGFENVTITQVLEAGPYRRDVEGPTVRRFRFQDTHREPVAGVFLRAVTQPLEKGQRFAAMRGIVHQPRRGQYEVIVEMDKHLVD